jgi:geranylgeranyl diphosphate synthase type II
MIEYKTAVLVGAAMKMGAIIAKTSAANADLIYEFGLNLGIAFQLQDDYLDAFGDPKTFGKQVGGDIIENKKTYLYLKALEYADGSEKEQLLHLCSISPSDPTDKINSIKEIFKQTNAAAATQDAIKSYTNKAFETLDQMQIHSSNKDVLRAFGAQLMGRQV